MKKVLLMFVAAGFLIATPSCKKGENDPFLSLKSRKSRLAGEYDISNWIYTISRAFTNGDQSTSTTTINGSTGTIVTSTTPSGEGTTTVTQNLTVDKATFTIMKDGTWESELNTTSTNTEDGGGVIIDNWVFSTVSTSKESGTWSFLGGQADDFKNKERVAFNSLKQTTTSQTTTTTNFTDGSSSSDAGTLNSDDMTLGEGQSTMIYEIDQLKNKEVILKADEGSVSTESETEDGVTYTYSVTETGSTDITLTAK